MTEISGREKSSAWGFILREGKVLFIRRSQKTTRPGQWCPPGGGVNAGESPREACVREVYEEVGLHVKIVASVKSDETFHYFLCAETSVTAENIKLAVSECDYFIWTEPDQYQRIGDIMEFRRMERVMPELIALINTL